jgi:hypothetical protein
MRYFLILLLLPLLLNCSSVAKLSESGQIKVGMTKTEVANTLLWKGEVDDDPWLSGCFYEYYHAESCHVFSGQARKSYLVFCGATGPSNCDAVRHQQAREGSEELVGIFNNYEDAKQSIKIRPKENKFTSAHEYQQNHSSNREKVFSAAHGGWVDPSVIKQSEERSRFEEDKRQREQPKSKQRVSLQVTNTTPDSDGSYTIFIRTNADTASLKVNGEELGGREDGRYSVKKFARVGGDTQFNIVATDINGNTDTKTITVSRPITESKPVTAALNPAQVKKQPERDAVAIIIGIADYKNLPRADYANDDARVFYDYAIRAIGIKPENIKLLVDADADQTEIYRAFKTWLPSRVRASTDVYVYYSGHGLPTADGQGLYLLPQRADRDFIDKTAIMQAEINVAIQSAKPRSVTVFLDSCYSGQARTGETLVASARPVALKVEKRLFPDNFTVIAASQSDQISSSSPDLKHGIFSYYLMRGMEGDADLNRDGKITAGEMHGYLTEQVIRQAGMMNRRQEPQLIGDANRVLVGR